MARSLLVAVLAFSCVIIGCNDDPPADDGIDTDRRILKGIYHRSRSGVGRFSRSFVVHKSLCPTFDKYEGRYIEVHITKGGEFDFRSASPILEVEKIVELPQPALSLTLETIPSRISPGESFQLLGRIKNTSNKTVIRGPQSVTIAAMPVSDVRGITVDIQEGGYAQDQAMGGRKYQLWNIVNSIPERKYNILGHREDSAKRVSVRPGESFPFVVVFDRGFREGQYEAEVRLDYYMMREPIPVVAWLPFDISEKTAGSLNAKRDLTLTMDYVMIGDPWFSANLTLKNNGDRRRMLPRWENPNDGILWAGRLFGWSSDGGEIPLRFTHRFNSYAGDPWSLHAIDPGGIVKFDIRFRPYSPDSPLARITCELLTDQGLEEFVVVDSLDDASFVEAPSFGPEVNGVKCRVHTDSLTYKRGDRVILLVERVIIEQPLTFRTKRGWTVEVDGKQVVSRFLYEEPTHFILEIDSSQLSGGEHTAQVSCIGEGGSTTSIYGKAIPIFKGKLVSNSWSFTIEEE